MCHFYYVLDWVVCNISVVPEPGSSTAQQLYITRMQKNRLPVVMLARDMKYPRVWEKINYYVLYLFQLCISLFKAVGKYLQNML